MSNTKKVTKAERFAQILEVLKANNENGGQVELVDFVEHEIELVNKRNSKKAGSLTKAQKENLVLIEKIDEWFLESANPETAYTSAEVSEQVEELKGFTPQKLTALLKKAENAERVEQATSDKKKVGYKAI